MGTTATGHRIDPPIDIAIERTRSTWLERLVTAAGVAAAVLTSADGSAGWRLVRAVAVIVATAATVRLIRRMSPAVAGGLALVIGVPLVAIGAGFAPHWLTGHPGVVPISSAVLAVAAVALVAIGTHRLSRTLPWWRRALTGAGVVIALAVTAFVVGPAVAATNTPHADIDAIPDDVGLTAIDVTLRTGDGVDLAGWYVESRNRAAVVLLHGAGSTRSDVLDRAVVLAEAGFGVLMIDARGHGESGGRAMDFGWDGDADIAAATGYLATRPDVDRGRIGLVGMSMGGEQALGASGSDPYVRAVVAEGATARCAADEAWLSDRYGIRGLLTEQLERAQDLVTDALTDASVPTSMRAAVAASGDTRYLLITAEQVPDEADAATFIAGGAPDRVTTWTVPRASHTGGLATDPVTWTARVTDFLTSTLLDP